MLAPVLAGRAQSVETLDLKPFTGPSPFDTTGAAHLLPRGRQVLDGVPFQIEGVVALDGGSKGKTNVSHIPVGRAFERLHLLAATRNSGNDAVAATIQLTYADQSTASLELRFGRHLRQWFGPWHKKQDTVTDTNCVQAWEALASDPAESDNILRLLHVALTNPFPDKTVTSLSAQTSKARMGLLLVGASVGPVGAGRLEDTVPRLRRPIPDLVPRTGAPTAGQGVVKTEAGEPIVSVLVRVIGARNFKTGVNDASEDDPSVGKESYTAADGTFALPAMPDNKLYSLAIIKDGFEPLVYGGEDPGFDPIDVRLKPRSASQPVPKYAVHGRLVGPDGKPVPLVRVERDGVALAHGRGWGWEQEGWPDRVLADTNGEFTIARDKEFTEVQIRTRAPGFAPHMEWLPVSNTVQTVQLVPGATLIGRVVTDGQPVAGVRVGISGWDRNSETYAGHYDTATRPDGKFEFSHLPPNIGWAIYGLLSSFTNHAALPLRQIQTSADSTTNDLGDMPTKPALHLAGKIKTRDDSPLPKSVTVNIGFENAWDSQDVKVDSDGRFFLDGLYTGQIEIWVRAAHWRLSGANRSATGWNPGQLSGLLEQDKEDLVVEIEKGEWDYNAGNAGGEGNGQLPPADQPQGRPIHGAELSGGPVIVLDGQVVDDETGRPLPQFKIVPGYQPPKAAAAPQPMLKKMLQPFAAKKGIPWNERIWWDRRHTEIFTNGVFSLKYLTLTSQPVFRVEAAGYDLWESEPIGFSTNNLRVRLKHGHGPSGIVLLPGGEPAEKATVVFAAAGDSFSFDHKTIGPNGQAETNGRIFQVTGPNGAFSFQPRSGGRTVYVSHPAGWAEAEAARPGDPLKLRLKPWADLKGVLVYSNGTPAVGEQMGVNLGANWAAGDPIFYFQQTSRTDSQGRFSFEGLPPRLLHIERRVPMGGRNGWSDKEQTHFDARSGVTNDVGKLIFDTPPPAPLGQQLRQKLGLDK